MRFTWCSYEKEIADFRANPSNYADESEASESSSEDSSDDDSDSDESSDSDSDSGDSDDDGDGEDDDSDDGESGAKAKTVVKSKKARPYNTSVAGVVLTPKLLGVLR